MEVDLSQLSYYIVLLLFLSSFLFYSSRKEILKSLQYLAIWAMIFVIFLMVVSYKESLINSRFAANFKPSHGVSQLDSITYYSASDTHFYIGAKLNGNDITFLVDTGATDIILGANDAKKLGIDLASLKYNKSYSTANGVVQCASVIIHDFRIKDFIFKNVYVSVNPHDLEGSLLGISFLQLFSKYEFSKDSLVLYR